MLAATQTSLKVFGWLLCTIQYVSAQCAVPKMWHARTGRSAQLRHEHNSTGFRVPCRGSTMQGSSMLWASYAAVHVLSTMLLTPHVRTMGRCSSKRKRYDTVPLTAIDRVPLEAQKLRGGVTYNIMRLGGWLVPRGPDR